MTKIDGRHIGRKQENESTATRRPNYHKRFCVISNSQQFHANRAHKYTQIRIFHLTSFSCLLGWAFGLELTDIKPGQNTEDQSQSVKRLRYREPLGLVIHQLSLAFFQLKRQQKTYPPAFLDTSTISNISALNSVYSSDNCWCCTTEKALLNETLIIMEKCSPKKCG